LLLWKGSSSNPFIKSPSFSEIIATPFSSIKGHASVTMQLGRMRFSSTLTRQTNTRAHVKDD
jgi:hypothetical protein